MGGIKGADNKCQARAVAAGLAGTFMAWLSDSSTSPSTRFTKNGGPYLLVDGGLVARNWSDLTSGSIRHAINKTESGGTPPNATGICTPSGVWADTDPNGTLYDVGYSCGDWTDSTYDFSQWGDWSVQDSWSGHCFGGTVGCGSTNPLYCFQQ